MSGNSDGLASGLVVTLEQLITAVQTVKCSLYDEDSCPTVDLKSHVWWQLHVFVEEAKRDIESAMKDSLDPGDRPHKFPWGVTVEPPKTGEEERAG